MTEQSNITYLKSVKYSRTQYFKRKRQNEEQIRKEILNYLLFSTKQKHLGEFIEEDYLFPQ